MEECVYSLRLTRYQKTKRDSLYWFYDLPHNYQSTIHLFGCVVPVYLFLLHFETAVYISVCRQNSNPTF